MSTVSAPEIVPLTDDQKAAIRECRFCFRNAAQTIAWAFTYDAALAARCPGGKTPFTRARLPEILTEYEIQMAHPEAVACVAQIQEERKRAA